MKNEFNIIPEFAPQKAVWLQWPTSRFVEGIDESTAIPAFLEITRGCQTEGEVHIIVMDENAENGVKDRCSEAGIPLDNIFFHILPYDSCWSRDSGPIFIGNNGKEHILDFGFNGWGYAPWGSYDKDDQVPKRISELLGVGYTQVQYIDTNESQVLQDLIYEGGSLEYSGEGTTVGSWAICKHRNPNITREEATRIFRDITNAHTIIWIDSIDPGTTAEKADNHTDGYMKFYERDKVCVLDSGRDGPGREAATKLEQAGWDVYRLPPEFRWTFVNSFIFNRKVIAGFVDIPMTDSEEEIMRDLFPRRTMIAIEISPLAKMGGGVHCVTQQQPLDYHGNNF